MFNHIDKCNKTMEVKKFRKILIGIIIFVVIVSIMAVFYTLSSYNLYDNKSNRQNIQNEHNAMYVLKDYDGRVAVFRTNEATPYMILDVYTSTLPNNDQITLSDAGGIPIKDDAGLTAIIEDFES